jgi:hypothetical protein
MEAASTSEASVNFYQTTRRCNTLQRYLLPPSLGPALMMEAASTSEMSVNFYQTTRRYNPEDSHLHNRRRENLKSYKCCYHQTTLEALTKEIKYERIKKGRKG